MISHCVLGCISLVTNDDEDLFMCLFLVHLSSLEKCLFEFDAHFEAELSLLLSHIRTYIFET